MGPMSRSKSPCWIPTMDKDFEFVEMVDLISIDVAYGRVMRDTTSVALEAHRW